MTDSVTFTLPWPPASLSPNARHAHWAPAQRAKDAYRDACFYEVRRQHPRIRPGALPAGVRFAVAMVFVPRLNRKRDEDNLVARMKAGLDGVALAWGIDDSRFHIERPVIAVSAHEPIVNVTVTAEVPC